MANDFSNGDTAIALTALGTDRLPGLLGLRISEVGPDWLAGELTVAVHHLAPHNLLHGGVIVSIADTISGFGCIRSLPDGARGFATAELKTNFLGTAVVGETISCTARRIHAGRSTQVWDAEVAVSESSRLIALFRCTQMVLYP